MNFSTSPNNDQQVSKKDQCKTRLNTQEFFKEILQRLAGKLLHFFAYKFPVLPLNLGCPFHFS